MAEKLSSGNRSRPILRRTRRRGSTALLALMAVGILAALGWLQFNPPVASSGLDAAAGATVVAAESGHSVGIKLLEPLIGDKFNIWEKFFLCLNVFIALAGLGYALMLVGEVKNADQGTPRMQEIARAVREGANAYLFRQ